MQHYRTGTVSALAEHHLELSLSLTRSSFACLPDGECICFYWAQPFEHKIWQVTHAIRNFIAIKSAVIWCKISFSSHTHRRATPRSAAAFISVDCLAWLLFEISKRMCLYVWEGREREWAEKIICCQTSMNMSSSSKKGAHQRTLCHFRSNLSSKRIYYRERERVITLAIASDKHVIWYINIVTLNPFLSSSNRLPKTILFSSAREPPYHFKR